MSHFSNNFYRNNREKFIQFIDKKSIAVFYSADVFPRNGDQNFPFRQNSDLLYLSGIAQEETILVLAPDANRKVLKEILFIKEVSEVDVIWHGKKLSKNEASDISGISTVYFVSQFDTVLHELMCESDKVYLWQNEFPKYHTEVEYKSLREMKRLKERYPLHQYDRSFAILEKLRLIKEPEEIEAIRLAGKITSDAFHQVLRNCKPGMMEYEVEADILYEFVKNNCKNPSFPTIVASGKNACCLHYVNNNAKCPENELLLIDFGAEMFHYAADCSRTIPVSGTFTARQKECYCAVLQVFKQAKNLYKPGNTINKVNEEVNKMMNQVCIDLGLYSVTDVENSREKDLFTKYYMHGAAHFIGLDVHDVGQKNTLFENGMVLSCEPGIYIPEENIGIRIETDMLVDENPVDLLESIPVEVEEIELLMKKI